MKLLSYLMLVTVSLAACRTETNEAPSSDTDATVYFGGDIITMEGDRQPTQKRE